MMNAAVLLACLLLPQNVDQARVDRAIQKGIEYLKTQMGDLGIAHKDEASRYEELVLLTMVHAGVPENDPDFKKLFTLITETPLERTYNVSIQAMILEELDRVKHQYRIAQCAQFLADNQADNGQWDYGKPTLYVDDVPTILVRRRVATSARSRVRRFASTRPSKPKVVRKIRIQKKRPGPDNGDNSNSQYAMLGLRACHDAGIVFETSLVRKAQQWWRESQKSDGGWCYKGPEHAHQGYGSMTVGAIGGLVICDYILKEKWTRDRDVAEGMAWMAKNFTVKENPGPPVDHGNNLQYMVYYYLYGMERLGMLYGTEKIGTHDWYPEGASFILDDQHKGGSWDTKIRNTCFAILFLRRATRPLRDVASVDRAVRRR